MKKVFFAVFFVFVFFAACSNNNKDDVYGGFEDEDYEPAETTDEDREALERPDEASRPGGSGGSGNENPSGSDGSSDDGNAVNDDDSGDENDENGEISDEENDAERPDEDSAEEVYALEPDVASCTSGIPSDSEKKKVLDRINYLRSIHKLKPVVYDEKDDEIAAECALVIAANQKLSHKPENSWKCWSQEAYDGCDSSNIFIQWANHDISDLDSTEIVDAFFTDEDVESLGHRRWLIDPWLEHVSFGRADYYDGSSNSVVGSAIKVINNDRQNISDTDIEFVAYPFHEYPSELYNDNVMMSFSVIKDKLNKYSNGTNLNLASAAIAITDPDNKTMKVKNILFDTDGYGVPNNVRWFAEGVKPNVRYAVTVSNIMVDNVSTLYQYWFELK